MATCGRKTVSHTVHMPEGAQQPEAFTWMDYMYEQERQEGH